MTSVLLNDTKPKRTKNGYVYALAKTRSEANKKGDDDGEKKRREKYIKNDLNIEIPTRS